MARAMRPHSELVKDTWNSLASLAKTSTSPATVHLDGYSLDLAGVVAVSRFFAPLTIDQTALDRLNIDSKGIQTSLAKGEAIYGVTTGFGGSADTRTKQVEQLQATLVRELKYGVLPSSSSIIQLENSSDMLQKLESSLANEDPSISVMPEAWSRAALLIRGNSLIRGHSAVRPVIVERIHTLLELAIAPKIPMHGSISASGDLSPLSYVGGAIQGKSTVAVWASPETKALAKSHRDLSAEAALAAHGLGPITLAPKEGLAIVNGTAVSCAAGVLALHDAHYVAVLSQILTAMSVEALLGTSESFDPFLSAVRPHPGQHESAQNIFRFLSGSKLITTNESQSAAGMLRQDRYSIRTASQWIGPVLEDFVLAHDQLMIECNSTTDNPLMDDTNGRVLNGGNFQAKAVTSAMEKIRQGVQTIGRMTFTQCTEIVNPAMNRGLPPNLVVEDPSSSYIFKGMDLMAAALTSELGFLANPVGTHVQTAEMGNQALNSLALISARYTHTSLDILSRLLATHLLTLCQALDLRALQVEYLASVKVKVSQLTSQIFADVASEETLSAADITIWQQLQKSLDVTVGMDVNGRFSFIANSLRTVVLDTVVCKNIEALAKLADWSLELGSMLESEYLIVRDAYMDHGSATSVLGPASKRMYMFVRHELQVPFLHSKVIRTPRSESNTDGVISEGVDTTVGMFVGRLYKSIRTGVLYVPALECLQEAF